MFGHLISFENHKNIDHHHKVTDNHHHKVTDNHHHKVTDNPEYENKGKKRLYYKEAKYRGVREYSGGKWVAEIREPGERKKRWLGIYNSLEDAARVHDQASKILYGEKAYINIKSPQSSSSPSAQTYKTSFPALSSQTPSLLPPHLLPRPPGFCLLPGPPGFCDSLSSSTSLLPDVSLSISHQTIPSSMSFPFTLPNQKVYCPEIPQNYPQQVEGHNFNQPDIPILSKEINRGKGVDIPTNSNPKVVFPVNLQNYPQEMEEHNSHWGQMTQIPWSAKLDSNMITAVEQQDLYNVNFGVGSNTPSQPLPPIASAEKVEELVRKLFDDDYFEVGSNAPPQQLPPMASLEAVAPVFGSQTAPELQPFLSLDGEEEYAPGRIWDYEDPTYFNT